jgi:hypothetical protein
MMRLTLVPICVVALSCASLFSQAVTLQFIVTVPADTDAKETIYLSGSHAKFGSWNGKGVALARQPNG